MHRRKQEKHRELERQREAEQQRLQAQQQQQKQQEQVRSSPVPSGLAQDSRGGDVPRWNFAIHQLPYLQPPPHLQPGPSSSIPVSRDIHFNGLAMVAAAAEMRRSMERASLDRQTMPLDRSSTSYDHPSTSFDRPGTSFERQSTSFDRQSTSFDRQNSLIDRQSTSMDRQSDSGSDYAGPSKVLPSPSPPSERCSPANDSTSLSSGSPGASTSTGNPGPSTSNGKRKGKGTPYIPSYMNDPENGPELCVVCGDNATGYHYRCMTCEGCKGFFRRTIQKDLQYQCKYNNSCVVDKNTRNQCQECRFQKCIEVGMATDLVLNERQRVAKRKLIEENRERRRMEQAKMRTRSNSCDHETEAVTEEDRLVISTMIHAYHNVGMRSDERQLGDHLHENYAAHVVSGAISPCITQVINFAKAAHGFPEISANDQITLLKASCMEIMVLKAATRYIEEEDALRLGDGSVVYHWQLKHMDPEIRQVVEPVFEFAQGLTKLQLDHTEIALLAGILLMQSDRMGLKDDAAVEAQLDKILSAYKHYVTENHPGQPVRWAKILMKVTDLRTISTRHSERLLNLRLDDKTVVPSILAGLFGNTPTLHNVSGGGGVKMSSLLQGNGLHHQANSESTVNGESSQNGEVASTSTTPIGPFQLYGLELREHRERSWLPENGECSQESEQEYKHRQPPVHRHFSELVEEMARPLSREWENGDNRHHGSSQNGHSSRSSQNGHGSRSPQNGYSSKSYRDRSPVNGVRKPPTSQS